ncbi:MAG: hypothetical protein ACI8YQ_003701 [Polaribacter sp.]|jgi:hypothetical protein
MLPLLIETTKSPIFVPEQKIMNLKIKNYIVWPLIILFAIGLYPISYIFVDMSKGLLGSKSEALLKSNLWNLGFYTHILLGGLALIIGWTPFIKK